ncbi:MAG: AbrB/MazE/SpoVT family DNA-binding domain-containing protein [Desulfuromonadales bacterium]
MIAQLVSIGNSKGIRIPAALLQQYQMYGKVEMLPGKDEIVIRPILSKPRQGWDSAFAAMHECGDDLLLIDDSFEIEDWEWS